MFWQISTEDLEASALWVEKYKPTSTKAIIGQQESSLFNFGRKFFG
jgi:hypothetical protein